MPIEYGSDFENVISRVVQPTGLKLQLPLNEARSTEDIVDRMKSLYGEGNIKLLLGGSDYKPLLVAASLPSHDNDRSYIVLGLNEGGQAELLGAGKSYSRLEIRQIKDLEPCYAKQLDVLVTKRPPQEVFEEHIGYLDRALNQARFTMFVQVKYDDK